MIFKTGDMVRVVKLPTWAQDLVGQLGIVTHLEDEEDLWGGGRHQLVYVTLLKNANPTMTHGYRPGQLELVK